jgi:RNA polymerase sigma-70 factor (ECF subfamily)
VPDDRSLVAALRAGDEAAFLALVERWHASMVRVARGYVPSRAVAEDVVQETWLAVVRGIDRFEERSSLKTWVFRILVNRAKTRGERERRTVPFSSLAAREASDGEASVDPERFGAGGMWTAPPARLPEDRLADRETVAEIQAAIDALPDAQRTVITLRDVEGWEAAEVAELLGISDGNQRVLLHRARSKVRAAVEVAA